MITLGGTFKALPNQRLVWRPRQRLPRRVEPPRRETNTALPALVNRPTAA
jgi:hypothetical protein